MNDPHDLKKPTSYSIDDATKERIDRLARSTQRSKSQVVRLAVEHYAENADTEETR